MNFTGLFFGAASAVLVTNIAENYLPVVAFMNASDPKLSGSTFSVRVTGYKVKDCRFVKGGYVGWRSEGGLWVETPFTFIADETPDSTRPNGYFRQDFGRWAWPSLPPGANKVKLSVQNVCGDNLEFTNIGPFTVSEKYD